MIPGTSDRIFVGTVARAEANGDYICCMTPKCHAASSKRSKRQIIFGCALAGYGWIATEKTKREGIIRSIKKQHSSKREKSRNESIACS